MGANRFECRVCPYEAPLDRDWFENTPMKQKEVDDIFGGAEEFANADSVASEFPVACLLFLFPFFPFFWFCFQVTMLTVPAQCPAEACHGERAYFFQLQIRSADEPMTTFLKV